MHLENNGSNYGIKTKGELRQIYNAFAPAYKYETFLNDYLFGVKKLRRELLKNAAGKILDVACGTGENFPFFKPEDDITAVDISPGMLSIAGKRAARLGLQVDLQVMDAEKLEFPDDYFDVVVTAMSTCTFPNPITALQEMRRVVRNEGHILLLEHGRSRWEPFGRYQDRSAHKHFSASGCRWNQDPVSLIDQAGLQVLSHEDKTLGVFHAVVARP